MVNQELEVAAALRSESRLSLVEKVYIMILGHGIDSALLHPDPVRRKEHLRHWIRMAGELPSGRGTYVLCFQKGRCYRGLEEHEAALDLFISALGFHPDASYGTSYWKYMRYLIDELHEIGDEGLEFRRHSQAARAAEVLRVAAERAPRYKHVCYYYVGFCSEILSLDRQASVFYQAAAECYPDKEDSDFQVYLKKLGS